MEDQMLNKLRSRAEDEKGFTLIELLVVILIIGILAAIAIPAFLNQKGKAYDSNAKSDARTAATAQETYFTDNNAYATTAQLASLTALEPTLNQATPTVANGGEALSVDAPGTALYGAPALAGGTARNSYDVTLTSKSNVQYAYIRYPDGTVARTCNVPAGTNAGGCKTAGGGAGNGTW
jgi:type IV pilus assembly protein PilA